MEKVLEGVYIGDFRASRHDHNLFKHNISHILSIQDNPQAHHVNIKYLCVQVSDTPAQNIAQYFGECIEFIHRARADGGNVLVHCLSGVSRAPTIVAAYLVCVAPYLTASKAISILSHICANTVSPNYGFRRQLSEWTRSQRKYWHTMLKRWPQIHYKDDERIKQLLEELTTRERGVSTDSVSKLDLTELTTNADENPSPLGDRAPSPPSNSILIPTSSDREEAILEHKPIIMGNQPSTEIEFTRDNPKKKPNRLERVRSALRHAVTKGSRKNKNPSDNNTSQSNGSVNNNGFVTKLNGSYYEDMNSTLNTSYRDQPDSAVKARLLPGYRQPNGSATLPIQPYHRANSRSSVAANYYYGSTPRRVTSVHIPEHLERKLVRSKSTGVLSEAEIRQHKTRTASIVKLSEVADWDF